jgi:c(7)-type cytochrome triheme protein
LFYKKIHFKNHTSSALLSALFVIVVLTLVSCSPAARNLFFDIPEPGSEPEPQIEAVTQPEQLQSQTDSGLVLNAGLSHPADSEENRPAIEQVNSWEEALDLLPKDAMGQPDWGAAFRDGVIMPRAMEPDDRNAEVFKLDFFLKGANPMFDAYFPHSSHLQWMGCESCHPAVFKYKDNDISMATINQGQYCGACHGKVAFAATNCKRCHTNM